MDASILCSSFVDAVKTAVDVNVIRVLRILEVFDAVLF
jgi:adenine-specific DNA glycosylase